MTTYYLQFDNYEAMKDFECTLSAIGLNYHEWENNNQYWYLQCELTEEVQRLYSWQLIKEYYGGEWCNEGRITTFWDAYERYRNAYRIYEDSGVNVPVNLYIRPVEY